MSTQQSSQASALNIKDILNILPHRYPFLLVDKVIHLNLEAGEIIALKNVTVNEPFFQGHWPGTPIMPGVLMLEALAQAGGILVHQKGFNAKIAVLLNMNNVKFRKPVVPGDALFLHVTEIHLNSKGGRFQTQAMVQDQLVVEAEIGFALVDKDQL